MREWLRDRQDVAKVYASPAARTVQTARSLFPSVEIQTVADLYLCSAATLVAAIETATLEHAQVALVGHNPAIAQVIDAMAGSSIDSSYPTLSVARFAVDVDPPWTYRLLEFVTPKRLRGR